MIRQATHADCAAIAALYEHYVETSTATFDLEAPSAAQWAAKLDAIMAAGRPFLVLHDEEERLIGYAYLATYRDRGGWAYTAEDSIYLAPEAAGRGLGSELLRTLLDAADPSNVRQVMALISDEVPSSVRLHEKAGFVEIGRTPGVGLKFGRVLGCVYMQRTVG